MKLAVPSTGCAAFAVPATDPCEPVPPFRFVLGGVKAAFVPCPFEFEEPCVAPLTEPEVGVDVEVDVLVEGVLVELDAHTPAPAWAFNACTSTRWFLPFAQSEALCGWLLPGPYRFVDPLAPFCIAIWPAVLPLP